MSIKTSYIVISWNGLSYLRSLIESLKNQLQREDTELIYVDNGSTDGSQQYMESIGGNITTIYLAENRGVAAARNIGLARAKGQYLFILDNDIVTNNEAILAMEQYMDEHPRVGLCASKLLYPDGTLQSSCKVYPGIKEKIKHILMHQTTHMDYEAEMRGHTPFSPEYVIGACQMIRRDAFEKVGMLDEHIFYGPEDCDYCLRMRQNGWQVIYLPEVSMHHHCQRRTTTNIFTPLARKHIQALIYFYWKHKHC